MFKDVLKMLSENQTIFLKDFGSEKNDTNTKINEALFFLERAGYITKINQSCESISCAGCSLRNACLQNSGELFVITQKGKDLLNAD